MRVIYPITTLDLAGAWATSRFNGTTPTYTSTSGPSSATRSAAGIDSYTPTVAGTALFTATVGVMVPSLMPPRKGIIACHGLNNAAFDWISPGTSDYFRELCDGAGYAVAFCDLGEQAFGNRVQQLALDLLYTWVTTTYLGTPSATVGLFGVSAGGFVVLKWLKDNTSKVGAAVLAFPMVDLDTPHGTTGWSIPYSTDATNSDLYPSGITGGGRRHEINYAYLVADEAWNAGANPYNTTDWSNNVTSSSQDNVDRSPSSWGSLGVPIRVWHAERDATIPWQSSQWWTGAANNSNVTFRSRITLSTAGHSLASWINSSLSDDALTSAGYVPRWEFREHFLQHLG